MRRIHLLSMAVAFGLAAAGDASAASDFEVGARGAYWIPKLTGEVQTTNGVADTRLDVKDTLGMKDENLPFGEAFLRFGRTTLRAGYAQLSFDGNKTLTENITFNGQTFSVSDDIASKLDMKMIDGELQVDLLRPDLGVANLSLGVIAKVKYVDGEVELRDALRTETSDFKAPLPMVGAAAGVGALGDMIRVDARATGIAYSGNHLFDVDACASFAPLPFVRIQAGYRYIDLEIDEDDTLVSLKLKGPYIGAQLSF